MPVFYTGQYLDNNKLCYRNVNFGEKVITQFKICHSVKDFCTILIEYGDKAGATVLFNRKFV